MLQVLIRPAALAAFAVMGIFAQVPPAVPEVPLLNPAAELKPDEQDPMVRRAKDNLEQTRKLIAMGALPATRLRKAEEEVQDQMDMSILRRNLYAVDMLPEQMDQMVTIAQKMVLRRQRSMAETQQLLDAGVISRSEAEVMTGDLERAQSELQAARARAALIEQLAESVRIENRMASLESEAKSHPEWSGKVYTRYDGKGIFTPVDLRAMELAFSGKFAKPLPISADGETAVHRAFGFDHRGRVDVALNPDQPEGVWLMQYLESKHIPYFAFRMAVPHKATGAHIHVGPESTKLSSTG